uniref:Guanylate kinase-like domain-containing protein n=1 Tax=Amphora coffeiformis TaxID=265554 RepID=A0A7S3KXT1_9STRA
MRLSLLVGLCAWSASIQNTAAFVPTQSNVGNHRQIVSVVVQSRLLLPSFSSTLKSSQSGYVPPEKSSSSAAAKKPPLLPKPGDIVRFYDLDGGNARGQVLIGKLSYISTKIGSERAWTAEITELEDVGDGYYADYGSRKRQWKRTTRDLSAVSPVSASFVRSENAYKVPISAETGLPKVRAETYDLDQYPGPVALAAQSVNQDVVQADAVLYNALKGRLFRYAALAGLTGTLVADLTKGTDFAIIYGAGFVASLAYLFLLSLKTDTLTAGAGNGGFAQKFSNLRFGMPVFVLFGVALYNQSLGDANPVGTSGNLLQYVTAEQFAAAVVGFLTYRLPLFVVQIQSAFETDGNAGVALPGSAGIALQMVTQDSPVATPVSTGTSSLQDMPTVLLVSGPQATGRPELVQQLVASDNRFVKPTFLDKVQDPATYERLDQRSELLSVVDGRYGLTAANLVASAKEAATSNKVVVVDASVPLAQQLTKVAGLRLVGVWVGLDSVQDFETRIKADIANGKITIPEDDTAESVIRARIKDIVKEIEYGLSSGIFEFTVLNRDPETSIKQLQQAGNYCFK